VWRRRWLNVAATLLNPAGETPPITPPSSADGFPRCRLSDTGRRALQVPAHPLQPGDLPLQHLGLCQQCLAVE